MRGGFAKRRNFTGFTFSGGSTTADFPEFALGFAAGFESIVVSGARKDSGLGVAEGVGAASALSLLDVVGGVDDFDWPRAGGEKMKTRAAASTRGFIVLESLLGLSQNQQRFTLIKTLPGVWVLTDALKPEKVRGPKVETSEPREGRLDSPGTAKSCLDDIVTLLMIVE